MVIGNGMVAKRFEPYKNERKVIIFASGISNSKSSEEEAFKREIDLFNETIAQHRDKILVYFSTCSFYDPEEKGSRYILHKKEIENAIETQCRQYLIFRVSNLVGKSENPNTILNFFVNHILKGIHFDLWANATRNLIDLDDMYKIADHIIRNENTQNKIINIANPENYSATNIISTIETISKIKGNYTSVAKGNPFTIDISMIAPVIKKSGIQFGENYLINLLQKYYHFQ